MEEQSCSTAGISTLIHIFFLTSCRCHESLSSSSLLSHSFIHYSCSISLILSSRREPRKQSLLSLSLFTSVYCYSPLVYFARGRKQAPPPRLGPGNKMVNKVREAREGKIRENQRNKRTYKHENVTVFTLNEELVHFLPASPCLSYAKC